jgi:hypothetical protein
MTGGDIGGPAGPNRWLFCGALVAYVFSFFLLTRAIQLPGVAWAPGVRVELRGDSGGPGLQVSPRPALRRLTQPSVTVYDLAILGNLALAAAAYVILLRALRSGAVRPAQVGLLGGAVLAASAAMLLLPQLLSNDLFSYVLQGRIAHLWHGNPASDPPRLFDSDPFFAWTDRRWSGVPAVYGAVWLHLERAVTWVAESLGGALATYVLAYKLLATSCHLASSWLVWRILSTVAPERRVWGTFLYAGNPLALIELAGSGHNDAALVFFLLAGILLHLRGHGWLALTAFTGAMLIKWTGGAAVALYMALQIRSAAGGRARLRSVMGCAAVTALVMVAAYLPLGLPDTGATLVQAPSQTRLSNSLAAFVGARFFSHPVPGATAAPIIDEGFRRAAVQVGNVITLYAAGAALVLATSGARALAGCAWVLFVYCTLGTGWFWPWYVTWFVALAALLDWRVSGRVAVLFSCSSLAAYPLKHMPWRGLVMILPALALAIVLIRRRAGASAVLSLSEAREQRPGPA